LNTESGTRVRNQNLSFQLTDLNAGKSITIEESRRGTFIYACSNKLFTYIIWLSAINETLG